MHRVSPTALIFSRLFAAFISTPMAQCTSSNTAPDNNPSYVLHSLYQ